MYGVLLTTTIALSAGLSLETLIIFLALIVFCIVLLVLVIRQGKRLDDIDRRLEKLMRGKHASSLESEIIHLFEANDILTESAADIQKKLDRQQKMLDTCYRKAGLIKYDAFNQMGGKLSFALALINEEGDGMVLNSVHSPEGNYTYVKEVRDGRCELELGTEEKQALESAMAME